MTFILHMRGATGHEGQIGRVWWHIAYRRFRGPWRNSFIRIAPRDDDE
jgi:hypothetical protein